MLESLDRAATEVCHLLSDDLTVRRPDVPGLHGLRCRYCTRDRHGGARVREILGNAKTVRQLLKGVKYAIDYYQREYRWETKQVVELLDDLGQRFDQDYQPNHSRKQVKNYGHYFLGSIIISSRDSVSYIVDGQQRLTTLTLLLIYLNDLKETRPEGAESIIAIDDLIYSEQYGEKSFNLNVEEREACMLALFEGSIPEPNGQPESVRNIIARYQDIAESFPENLTGDALPFFVDWLIENVHLVEITAYSDEDAYLIFETMNDRGLSLTPTDMLKGYLLANIDSSTGRDGANTLWRRRIQQLDRLDKDLSADAIKAWLRSQYADSIRERRKGATPQDYDLIGTEFHRWVRDNHESIGLANSATFTRFIENDFDFYGRQYVRIAQAGRRTTPGLELIRYNADHGYTLQNMLLLAPLVPDDARVMVDLKLRLVAKFVDILIAWRLWNFRSIAYSTMQYAMFQVTKRIRHLEPESLAQTLHAELTQESEDFDANDQLYVHQQNRRYLQRMLARMIDYLEIASGNSTRYDEYVTARGKQRYEIEHIWANKPERFIDEFPQPADFEAYRNRIGGLLLLSRSFNASYGALTYEEKLPHYGTQDLWARSLHPQCYEHNPGFLRFVHESGLPFHPHKDFKRKDLDERGELLRQLAKRVWNPDDLLAELGN